LTSRGGKDSSFEGREGKQEGKVEKKKKKKRKKSISRPVT